jgi:hypothetical protein
MEILSTNSNAYSTVSSSQTSTTQSDNNSFSALLNTQIQETTEKKETFRVVAFIDKYTSFSSLSPTEEKIFRDILADDSFTLAEIQSLSFEQVKKLGDFLDSALYGSGISADKIPLVKSTDIKIGAMFTATRMTDNEDFNKAVFETVQTIDEQIEMLYFFDRLSANLGWNDKRCLIPQRDNPELRKNSTKENWEISDYKKFMEAIVKEYYELVKNPVISEEDRKLYQKLLNDFIILQKKHNEIKSNSK